MRAKVRSLEESDFSTMIRTFIGATIILTGFILKATLNHNIEYWGNVKSWTVFLFIVGLIITGMPILEWIDKAKPRTFRIDPPRYILYVFKSIVALVIMVAIAIQFEKLGIWTNEKLVEHYLRENTGITEGVILGERKVYYSIKTIHYEKFYVIRYIVDGEVIEQGVKPSYSLNIGQTYNVTYSTKFPSIFKVGHRKRQKK